MNSDHSLTAVFSGPPQYSLTVNIQGSGSVTPNIPGPYAYGAVVELIATPESGWAFSGWSGDLSGSANPEIIVMDSDKTVNAAFTSETYSLTVNVEGSGSTDLGTGVHGFDIGSVVTVTAYPEDGWQLEYWLLDEENLGNEEKITCFMSKNSVLTAFFVEIEPSFPRALDVVLIAAAGGSVIAGSSYLIYHRLHPKVTKETAKDISEKKAETDEDKKKKKKKLPKKAHLTLTVIESPKIIAGGMTCKLKLRVKNLGPSSTEDVFVSVCSTPGLNWQNKVKKITSLKVGEEPTLDFTFTADKGLNRGKYRLKFTAKGKNTFRRVKTKKVQAVKIGLLFDRGKEQQLMQYKKWFKAKSISWDELHNADDVLELLSYDLIVATANFDKHPKWVRVLSSFVENHHALIRVTNKEFIETEILEKIVGK
jgi:hypothetical protein